MNRQIVVVGVLALLLLSSFAVGLGSRNVKGNAIKKISDGGVKGYTTHGVIRINNDTDFANQASQEGWQGDGSQSNPYVISGYDIDAHGAGDAIYIGNTTAYFVVENFYLHNASYHSNPYFRGAGISLYKVKNGKISSNNITNNGNGIFLDHSSSNTIIGNTIMNNGGGIDLGDSSSYNTISENNITNNGGGIWLYSSSSYNTIIGNNITNNSRDGIVLDSTSSNTISKNNITNNEDGIDLYWNSNSNTISGNTITNNSWDGIYLYSSSNIIYNNLISNNANYGVYIRESGGSYNLIYNNSFYYNHGSGDIYSSSHVQAYDDGSNNYWNSSSGIGNYWHDWANNNDTNDQNHDGIVDWPYKIDGSSVSKDYYPLKNASLSNVLSHPMNLTAKVGDGYVNLTWDPPVYGNNTVTEYKIYRNNTIIATVPANQLWYNDTNVSNGVTYTYYVTAVKSVGESEPSNEVSATPKTAPSAPQNLQATAGLLFVNLSWSPPADDGGSAITEYRIYRGTSSGGESYLATVNGSITWYNDTSVSKGQTYYYYVTAVNDAGEGDNSTEINATTPTTVPSAPQNLQASSGDKYVNLTWEPPADNGGSDITEYRIYRNGVLIKIKTVSGNQLYYNDTNVVNGQTYTYYVTAVNSVGESVKSNEVQATPGGAVPEFSTGIWLILLVSIALLGAIRSRKFS